MREVLLVRHGTAVANAVGGDAERTLTADGRVAIAAVARGLAALGRRPDALWHSPYVRAVETAEILADTFGAARSSMRAEPLLVPGGSAERAARAIVDADARCLLCVSHLPLLPELVGRLAGMRTDFGTGTVAQLALVGSHGAALIGLWSAQLLARVG